MKVLKFAFLVAPLVLQGIEILAEIKGVPTPVWVEIAIIVLQFVKTALQLFNAVRSYLKGRF